RKINWIGAVEEGEEVWYHPYKYKKNMPSGSSEEYAVVFRLAEQFLLRAEARARSGNSTGALADLNTIRGRAGLEPKNAASTEEILSAILEERRFELFTEYGHRWFDIKRFGRAGQILAPIKPNWQETQTFLPIPEEEIRLN